MKKNNQGVAHLLLIIGIVILALIALSACVFMANTTKDTSDRLTPKETDYSQTEDSEEVELPVSDSDKTTDIDEELESTDLDDIEEDLDDLDINVNTL
jgi:hypothetical protein